MNDHDDEEKSLAFWEVTQGDPGHLGDDEPEIRPLCRECVRDLPTEDEVCEFCKVVLP